jgi:hypothetical protein
MAYVRLRSQRYCGENANVSDLRHTGNQKKSGQFFAAGRLDSPHESAEQSGFSVSLVNPGVMNVFSRDEVEADLACFDV